MINLLPYDIKKQIRAARLNVILVRYIFVLGLAAVFLILACATSYLILNIEKNTNDIAAERNKAQVVSPSSAQGQANTLRSELVTAEDILDQQVSYSDVITALGALLPKGVVVDNLTLTDSSFGASITLKVHATSANLETQLKQAFGNSTKFSGYNLISKAEDTTYTGYPTIITFSVTLNGGIAR